MDKKLPADNQILKTHTLTALGLIAIAAVALMLIIAISKMSPPQPSAPAPTSDNPNAYTPAPRAAAPSAHPQIEWEQILTGAHSSAYTTIYHNNFLYTVGTAEPGKLDFSNADARSVFVARLAPDGTLLKLVCIPAPTSGAIVSHTAAGNNIYLLLERTHNNRSGFFVIRLNLTDLSHQISSELGSPLIDQTPLHLLRQNDTLYIVAENSSPAAFKHSLTIYKVSTALKQLHQTRAQRSANINVLAAFFNNNTLTVWGSAKAGLSGYPTVYTYSPGDGTLTWRNIALSTLPDLTVHSVTPLASGYLLTAGDDNNHASALSVRLDNNLTPTHISDHFLPDAISSSAALSGYDSLLHFAIEGGGNLYLYQRLNSNITLNNPKGKLVRALPLTAGGFLSVHQSPSYTAVCHITAQKTRTLARTLTDNAAALNIIGDRAIITAHKNNTVYIYSLSLNSA